MILQASFAQPEAAILTWVGAFVPVEQLYDVYQIVTTSLEDELGSCFMVHCCVTAFPVFCIPSLS